MAYNGLTNAGAAYKAAREANNLPVEFLKAKVGNGIVPSGTDPAELTDIISGKMEVEITDIHQVERALKMTVQVSNESLATGFYLTEIAIYVNDNGTPVLYWYIGKDNGTYVLDSTKPMKYKNILNIEVSSTPVTTVNYTGKDLWIDEETLNAKFGTGEREILEGIRLAQILGLEFAGELNNSNTKKANKVYYDTQNKSYFKCLNDNVLNYADSNYYEGISNNNLLLKLQNLDKMLKASEVVKSYKEQWFYISEYANGDKLLFGEYRINEGDGTVENVITLPAWATNTNSREAHCYLVGALPQTQHISTFSIYGNTYIYCMVAQALL
ncbi:hypothetical protein [Fusobacterium ulcerans]|uniref:hypothetical protein n=1 Tax=Fusobacterium ulcerans TaxID=861 RepID=UPI0030A4185D